MDALTAQPSRTFKRWVNNPANPESDVVTLVVFTTRGDLQKAESLMYMASGVLQKMRRENAQNLPDYNKVVTVSGDGGRWEATIISQTQFGVESVTIYVPTIKRGEKKVEEYMWVEYPAVTFLMCPWPRQVWNYPDTALNQQSTTEESYAAYICTGVTWVPDFFYEGKPEDIITTANAPVGSHVTHDSYYGLKVKYTDSEKEVYDLPLIGHSYLVEEDWAETADEDIGEMPINIDTDTTSYPPAYPDDPDCYPDEWLDGHILTKHDEWTYSEWYRYYNIYNGREYTELDYTEWGHQDYTWLIDRMTWSPTPPQDFPWTAPLRWDYFVLKDAVERWDNFVTGYQIFEYIANTVIAAEDRGYDSGSHDVFIYTKMNYDLAQAYYDYDNSAYYSVEENRWYPDYAVHEWYHTHGYSLDDPTYYTSLYPDRWGISGAYVFHYQKTGSQERIYDNTFRGDAYDYYFATTVNLVVVVDGVERIIPIGGVTNTEHWYYHDPYVNIYDYYGEPLFVISIVTDVVTNNMSYAFYDTEDEMYITYISVFKGEWSILQLGPDQVDYLRQIGYWGESRPTGDAFWDVGNMRSANKGFTASQYCGAVKVRKKVKVPTTTTSYE